MSVEAAVGQPKVGKKTNCNVSNGPSSFFRKRRRMLV